MTFLQISFGVKLPARFINPEKNCQQAKYGPVERIFQIFCGALGTPD